MRKEFPLGEDGEGLSGGNLSVNCFFKLGAYAGRFENSRPSTSQMNNPNPILTNVYLDTPPVSPTSEPLEYSPPPGRLGCPQGHTQTRTGGDLHTNASPPPPPTS